MAFFSMSLMGMAPFGSLLAGYIADHVGAPKTVAGGGALCLAAASIFWLRLPALAREDKREKGAVSREEIEELN